MDKHSHGPEEADYQPSPADFELYLPWACTQLQMESAVHVVKVYQNEYVSVAITDRSKKGKSMAKMGPSRVDVNAQDKDERSTSRMTMPQIYEKRSAKIVNVQAIYDYFENLVEIKFDKNDQIPRILIKVVGLIVQFQGHLHCITINRGLDVYTVHEICKFLPSSHITDICLDDCYLKEPNYYILLDGENSVTYLSLCRCKIDDKAVEMICSKLIYPLPASRTLSILNLSSNRITDVGAKFLAQALRSNRHLSYLNLASNIITDRGAAAIFESLLEFPLTAEDIFTSKARYMTYLQAKNDMIALAIRDLRLGDADKRSGKRKSLRPPPVPLKKVKADVSQKSLVEPSRYLADVDSALVEKAINMVEDSIGEFEDPFGKSNTVIRNDVAYCKGNNSLYCLNLSYNFLSYLSLRKIESLLLYQKQADRKLRGLLSVTVEGNCLPIACKELSQIDDILHINLMAQSRRFSVGKKRPHSKTTPR